MAQLSSLGGVLPLVNRTLSTLNTVDRVRDRLSARDRDRTLSDQLSARNRLDEQFASERAMRDQAILNTEKADDERRRATALKRAVSRQRAIFGGSGVEDEDEGGSGNAVLLGLYNESDQDRAEGDNLFTLRRQTIESNLQNLRRRNLLEESQFMARRRGA